MKTTWFRLAPVVFVLIFAAGIGSRAQLESDRTLFEATCSRCHPAKASWRNTRSEEKWKSTVARMRRHAGSGTKAFDAEAAARIVAYLAPGRGVADVAVGASASAVAATPKTAVDEQAEHPHEDAGGAWAAKALGLASGAFLLLLVGSGLARRRLKRRFHRVHVTLVSAFGIVLAAHAALLYLQTGIPRTAWHLLGSAALATGVLNAAVGLGRRRLKRRFLPVHKALAALILVLAALHRVLF